MTSELPVGVTRRSLLKGLGAAGIAVVVGSTGVVSYRAIDNGVLDSGSGQPYEPWDAWRSDPGPGGAVAAAVMAANPHNTQPWRFHVRPDRIDMFSDASRQMPQTDPLLREHHIGLGCALENLLLAAAARGYRTDVILNPDPADATHLALISLARAPVSLSPLYDAIGERHSNRGPYTQQAIPATTLDDFAACALDLPGIQVSWLTSAIDRTAMGALILDATHAIVDDQPQSREGFSWFRNDRDDIDAHADGLTLDGQGLSALTLAAAKLLPASTRTAGDEFWLSQTRTVHTATAAAYGVVTVDDPRDVTQRLVGGRLLQRIHLAATSQQLGLQHMNQVTERIDRDAAQQTRSSYSARLDALVGQPGRHALATFRLGHPQRLGRRSPRRPLAAVLQ